jgi:hypothetical protein
MTNPKPHVLEQETDAGEKNGFASISVGESISWSRMIS